MVRVIVKDGSGVEIRNQIFASQALADEWIAGGEAYGSFGVSYTIEQSNPSVEVAVARAIANAIAFGQHLIGEFGIRNVLANKTDAQIDNIMGHASMSKIAIALQSGSVKYAKRQLEVLTPFDGVSQDDINWLIAKINSFLGL